MADTRTIPDDLTDDQISELATESGFGFFGKWQLYQGNRDELLRFARAILARSTARAPVDASAQEAAPQQGEWRPIETAPKDERLMLFFPPFGAWVASWWPGSWSWAREQWVIHSPFASGDRAIMGADAPQPTHWMPLPNPPASLQQHDQQEGAA